MALSLLNSAWIVDPVKDGGTIAAPVAGVALTFDAAWGPASGDAAMAVSTTLSCPGATIDTTFGDVYNGHAAGVAGRIGVDQGWSSDGKLVYLTGAYVALAFWRLTFPSSGPYTITLANVGTLSFTVSGVAPVATVPVWTVLQAAPMGRAPAKIGTIAFNGVYPAGGLTMTDALIGLYGVQYADINPQQPLSFTWAANRLKVFNAAGEIATGASINFTTTALFIGVGM